jgi:hypothetical protein
LLVGPRDLAKKKDKMISYLLQKVLIIIQQELDVILTYFALLHSDTNLHTNIFISLGLRKRKTSIRISPHLTLRKDEIYFIDLTDFIFPVERISRRTDAKNFKAIPPLVTSGFP